MGQQLNSVGQLRVNKKMEGPIHDIAAGVSAASAGVSWLSATSDALSIIATVIAIVAGLYAVKWHHIKIKDAALLLKRHQREENESNSGGPREAP